MLPCGRRACGSTARGCQLPCVASSSMGPMERVTRKSIPRARNGAPRRPLSPATPRGRRNNLAPRASRQARSRSAGSSKGVVPSTPPAQQQQQQQQREQHHQQQQLHHQQMQRHHQAPTPGNHDHQHQHRLEHQQQHQLHHVQAASQEHHVVRPPGASADDSGPASTSTQHHTTNPGNLTPAEADAARLFDFEPGFVPAWSPSLLAYFPLGCALAVLRMGLWVGGVIIDAEAFKQPSVASAFLRLLGFRCRWRGVERLPPGRHIMVTNHVTPADLLVLFEGLPQRYIHLITQAMPQRCTTTRNLPLVLRYANPDVVQALADPPAEDADVPIHLHPEGGLTNGRWGMMQFSRGFTKMLRDDDVVVPVALRPHTPWNLRTHTLNSSFAENFFWVSFCPWFEIEATVLPPLSRVPGETRGAFARRVQQSIADELGHVVSSCSIAVKKRVMKQEAKRAEERR